MTRHPTLPAATKVRLLGSALACAAAGLVACGSAPRAGVVTSQPPPISAPEKYRFALPPVVVFDAAHGPLGEYRVFVRTNRPLPRDAHGITATFQLDGGTGSFGRPRTESRRPSCYSSEISATDNPKAPQNILHPHDGALVTVTLRFPGHNATTASVPARAAPPTTAGSGHLAIKYLRGLGCHVSASAAAR